LFGCFCDFFVGDFHRGGGKDGGSISVLFLVGRDIIKFIGRRGFVHDSNRRHGGFIFGWGGVGFTCFFFGDGWMLLVFDRDRRRIIDCLEFGLTSRIGMDGAAC
jgi:hypothetical protein